ncbi:MAG: MBL fold metallo-hydrolase, partial [Actinomycetota bacterium]
FVFGVGRGRGSGASRRGRGSPSEPPHRAKRQPRHARAPSCPAVEGAPPPLLPHPPPRDGASVEAPGAAVVAVATPGHSADHVAFHLPATGMLFTGDAVLGRGTSVIDPPDGDLVAYLRSLRRMRDLAPRTIHPGHGPIVLRAVAKLDAYLAHRAEREAQVLAALRRGPATPERLVDGVYADLAPEARGLAARTVLAHLEKLEEEGLARHDADGTFHAATPSACDRCGRPVRGRGRICAACAVSSLQEPG